MRYALSGHTGGVDNVLPFLPRHQERQRRGSMHPAGTALRWATRGGTRAHRIDPMTGGTRCGIVAPLVIDHDLPECLRCSPQ